MQKISASYQLRQIFSPLFSSLGVCLGGLGILCSAGCSSDKAKGFTISGHGNAKRQITLLTIEGAPAPSWKTDSKNNVYINSRTLTLGGTCVALGSFLVYGQNKLLTPPALCDQNANFSWAHTADADGTLALEFRASDSTVLGSTSIVVDTVAPPAPIITTNSGASFTVYNPSQTIAGTMSTDTHQITSDDPLGKVTFSGTQFELNTVLGFASTKTFSIYAVDLAGNQSPPAHITIQYQASASLVSTGFSGAGLPSGTLGSQGLARMEGISVAPIITTAATGISNPGSKHLNTGFIEISEDEETP